jgi:hypothetical protein
MKAEEELKRLELQFKLAEKMPSPVINPSYTIAANSAVFFMYMPKVFGLLSEWSLYSVMLMKKRVSNKRKSCKTQIRFKYIRGGLVSA